MANKWLEPSWLFDRAIMAIFGPLFALRRHSPHIVLLGNSDAIVEEYIARHVTHLSEEQGRSPSFLDVGARDAVRATYAKNCEYTGCDINPQSEDVVAADICHCPHIPDASYDIMFSYDLLEHVQRPWEAAAEMLRLTKPGGLIICRTLFAYRHHPEPYDYWRFSSHCLEYLFTGDGKAETLVKGYDVRERRRNRLGETIDQRPPLDWLGGWRENWQVLWIGRKL